MKNLLYRLISAVILGSLAVAGIYYLPVNFLTAFVLLIIAVVGWEVGRLLSKKEQINPVAFGVSSLIAGGLFIFIDLYVSLLFILIYAFYFANKRWSINTLSLYIFGLLYSSILPASIADLIHFDKFLLYTLFATVWAGDTFAYLFGKTIGKRKLAPRLSPNKTIEGAVGGFLGATIIGGLTAYYLSHIWIIPAVLISAVVMQVGDLFESFIKRQVGEKDSSNLIPGHGGLLDRIDALLFASLVFAGYISIYLKFHLSS